MVPLQSRAWSASSLDDGLKLLEKTRDQLSVPLQGEMKEELDVLCHLINIRFY